MEVENQNMMDEKYIDLSGVVLNALDVIENASISKEKQALQDVRQVLQLVEKRVNGELEKTDREGLEKNWGKWQESISILREDILNNRIYKCKECGQKIRVPKNKSGEVTCPKCDQKFMVRENSIEEVGTKEIEDSDVEQQVKKDDKFDEVKERLKMRYRYSNSKSYEIIKTMSLFAKEGHILRIQLPTKEAAFFLKKNCDYWIKVTVKNIYGDSTGVSYGYIEENEKGMKEYRSIFGENL